MKRILTLFTLFATLSFSLQAQEMPAAPVSAPVFASGNSLYGRIVDVRTNKGLEAVSVQLYGGKSYDSLVTAMFTRPNGDFRFDNLPAADSFKLLISGIGYQNIERTVAFSGGDRRAAVQQDLGNLSLELDARVLSTVVVSAERPALEMGIDRRVFSVDQSLTATGGTAVDVMKNIPSVSVDVEGNVTLRNSSPQIFVDGRPTILTLDQIPANDIERVELITNPSAKFDAASTGGIINVVMKRNRRAGINGIASVGAGIPDIFNGSLSLNLRQNKFNFFITGNYNQSGGEATSKTFRENKVNGSVDNYFNQQADNNRSRKFTSARFGIDYFIDNRNTVSLTQGLVMGKFGNNEIQEQQFLNSSKVLERYGDRYSESESDFNRYNTQLNFIHKFPQSGRELTANINYNFGDGGNTSDIVNSFFNPDRTLLSQAVVRNDGSNDNNQVTFQVDYVHPKGDDAKIETGLRSYVNNYENRFDAVSISNGTETLLPLSNNIEYREIVNALYVTYSNKINTFSYQAGLRAEHSKFEGKLLDTGKEFGYNYPNKLNGLFDALFPSLFLTKKLSDKAEVQLNYSRRINRPNFWQLNPFVNINDPLNISQGNPELRPEFTNSYEFNYSTKYKGGNFLGSVFYRNTQGDITRFSDTISAAQYQQLNEAAIEPNAILNTFINARSMNRIGAELTLQHKIGKQFDLTPSVNGEYQMVNAERENLDLSNEGFNWEAKLIANYRVASKNNFLNNFSFQAIGEYESPRILPQGKGIEEYSVDLAIRKDFLKKKKASVTFSVNDIFWTDRGGAIYDTENFYQESIRRNLRTFRLTFTYKFGKTDFKLFNPRTNNNGNNVMEDDGF